MRLNKERGAEKMNKDPILKRFFFSVARHLRILFIAAAFSTVVYGGIYLVMYLTGRI